MEKAKQAVRDFVPSGNKHRTTLDQDVRAAVTDEHVKPHRHENVTTALDKEIHQDHHHTVVQPVKHTETLPEQHHHNIVPVEHRSFEHGNERDVKATLERDAAQFKNKSVTHETTHSSTTAPVVAGERTYHHVHEHIQPIIQKETIQPQVVHTTIPVHETHHAATLHHGTSTLPAKTMADFVGDGGKLEGRGVKALKDFEGCPQSYKENMQNEQLDGDRNMHITGAVPVPGRVSDRSENLGAQTSGSEGRNMAGMAAREAEATTGSRTTKDTTLGRDTRDSGVSMGTGAGAAGESKAFFGGPEQQKNTTLGSSTTANKLEKRDVSGTDSAAADTTTQQRKPSLMDRLNPRKDADGDGKKGFLN